jgi:hypothetical protein
MSDRAALQGGNGTNIKRMSPTMEMVPRTIETIGKSRVVVSLKRYTVIAAAAPAANDTSAPNPGRDVNVFRGRLPLSGHLVRIIRATCRRRGSSDHDR